MTIRSFMMLLVLSFITVISSYNIVNAQSVLTTIKVGPAAGNGLGAHGIATNPVTNKIYVANHTTGNVSVIDGTSNELVDTVKVGDNPEFIAVNSDTNMIYVTGLDSSSSQNTSIISVIDGTNNQVVRNIKVSEDTLGEIAINQNRNMIYVLNPSVFSVNIIDGTNNRVADKIATRMIPLSIAFNHATNKIYVSGSIFIKGTSVSIIRVINGENNRIDNTIRIRGHILGNIAVNSNTNKLYVVDILSTTDGTEDIISVIDGSIDQIVDTIAVNSSINSIAINTVTDTIYATSHSTTSVIVIDGVQKQVIDNIELNVPGINSVSINPVTSGIYVTNSSSVNVIDGINNQITNVITLGISLGNVAVNINTNTIYVANSNNSITVIDGASNQIVATIDNRASQIAVNPGTNRIYAVDRSSIVVIDGSSNLVVDNIEFKDNPIITAITINPINNMIYFAGFMTKTISGEGVNIGFVSIIDGTNNQHKETITMPLHTITDIAVNPVTNKIYFVSTKLIIRKKTINVIVSVIDGTNNRIIDKITLSEGSLGLIAVNPNSNTVYVTDLISESILVINGSNNQIIDAVELKSDRFLTVIRDIAVNPSTNNVYVLTFLENKATVISGLTNRIIGQIPVGDNPFRIAIDKLNSLIYVSNDNSGDITVINDQ